MRRRVFLRLCFAVIVVLCPLTRAEATFPKVGGRPPALGLEKILQAAPDAHASWEALKGKVVVLEFWATWCGPCVAAIPHLNEMADHFRDKPVQFIAITDEKENAVAPFLKKRPIRGWVGLDTDKSMLKAYGIKTIPHTVVVNREGIIAAITYPAALTEQHLEDLVAGRMPKLTAPNGGWSESLSAGELPESSQQNKKALLQVLVRPSEKDHASLAIGDGSLSILGEQVLGVLSTCHDVNAVRIATSCVLPEGRFDFVVKTPSQDDEAAKNWLREAVEAAFGLRSRRESRTMDVYLLTSTKPNPDHFMETATEGFSSSSGPGELKTVGGNTEWLAYGLESLLKKPVLDETMLSGRYDFDLKWDANGQDPSEPEALIKAVHEQLGLDLLPARRSVEVVVVDSANATNTSTKK